MTNTGRSNGSTAARRSTAPKPADRVKSSRSADDAPGGKQKHVLLMITTERVHGRSILAGIGDYTAHHAHWLYHLEIAIKPELVAQGGVDGMIVEAWTPDMLQVVRETNVPTITVGRSVDPLGKPAVVVDNVAVGRMAGLHLADLGFKHLAYVHGGPTPWSRDRQEGFVTAATDRRIECHVLPDEVPLDREGLVNWIRSLPEPVGIFAANDQIALNVSHACREAGRRIPEQAALIGVDNESETCRLAHPPLSSIDHGTRRIGYEAAKLLDAWMSTGVRPISTTLIQPVGVIARPSTDLLAIDDPDIVAALRYIRSHTDEAVKVADVLRHVAMSRRTLEMRFRQALGRSIHDEITRVRIERAKQLLITSDWSIVHIGDACGFSFPSQFSYAFRRETGMPPQKFRDQYRFTRQLS